MLSLHLMLLFYSLAVVSVIGFCHCIGSVVLVFAVVFIGFAVNFVAFIVVVVI